jgi:hypothetical protein
MIPSLLRHAIFWIAAVLCVVGEIAIMRSMFRGSRVVAPDHPPDAGADVPRGRPVAELVWALLPAVMLVVILIFTLGTIR